MLHCASRVLWFGDPSVLGDGVPRNRKLLAIGLAGVLLGIVWPFTLPLGAANAAGATVALKQLTSFHEMVVDDVGGHASDGYIFLSQGLDSYALGTGGPSQ